MDAVAGDEQQDHRRGAPRRRVLMSAQIVYLQGRIAVDCVIRNISESGAQLETDRELEMPPSFWLRFQDGNKRPVELVWSKANLMGVRFIDIQKAEQTGPQAKAAPGVKAGLIARIMEMERQLAELRAEISISLRD